MEKPESSNRVKGGKQGCARRKNMFESCALWADWEEEDVPRENPVCEQRRVVERASRAVAIDLSKNNRICNEYLRNICSGYIITSFNHRYHRKAMYKSCLQLISILSITNKNVE